MSTEYRDIEGFPGYKVGDDGSVWSSRLSKERRLKLGERIAEIKRVSRPTVGQIVGHKTWRLT